MTKRCSITHPKYGQCINPVHDSSDPASPCRYDLPEKIRQAKTEILRDIAAGTVPATVTRFAQLHDFVDANCYGGLCEEPWYSEMRGDADDPSEAVMDYANTVQEAIHVWLQTGRP